MTTPMPPANFPAVDPRGVFTVPWQLYLKQIVTQPGAPLVIVPSASPFAYVASGPGSLSVTGGTVSAITMTRGGVTVPVGSPVQMANGDIATVTYSVAPTISFIPG